MSDHARLAPSSATRRIACPGSRALEAQYPQPESASAAEGHAAHWVAGNILAGGTGKIGSVNGLSVTQEMIDGAELYRKHVFERVDRSKLLIEDKLDISNIHKECWGTCDAWGLGDHVIHIWDYKFGHRYVEVFENWQLIEYAAGVIKKSIFDRRKGIDIHLHIVQPRCFHAEGPTRTWKTTSIELEEKYFPKLIAAECLAMTADAPRTPSVEGCKFCAGLHVCPEFKTATLKAIDFSKTSTGNPEELGTELKALKEAAELIDARITALSQIAIEKIRAGERVPYFRVGFGRGSEIWKISTEKVIELGKMFGLDLTKPVDVVTPKQAVTKGLPREMMTQCSEVKSGELKLIEDVIV